MDLLNTQHAFEPTLGAGPYRYVGFFYINIQAGQMGRPYYDASAVHPRFVRGAGTCAHCGHAILNVFQVQIGNGDVFGVGSDCIHKVGMAPVEMKKVDAVLKAQEKAKRAAKKKARGEAARTEMQRLLDTEADLLMSLPHPRMPGMYNLFSYTNWMLHHGSDNGQVLALNLIRKTMESK